MMPATADFLPFIFPLGRRVPNSALPPSPSCRLSTSSPSPSWLNSISKTPALGQSPTLFPESLLGPWGLSLCGVTSFHCLSMHGPSFHLSGSCHQKPPVPHQADAVPSLPLLRFISSAHAIYSPGIRLLPAGRARSLSCIFPSGNFLTIAVCAWTDPVPGT